MNEKSVKSTLDATQLMRALLNTYNVFHRDKTVF